MSLNWNFQRWGVQTQKNPVGGVWIFSGTTNSYALVKNRQTNNLDRIVSMTINFGGAERKDHPCHKSLVAYSILAQPLTS